MFAWIPFSLFIYTALRLVAPLPLPPQVKTVAAVVLLLAALKQQVFMRFGGSYFSPELPTRVIEIYGAAFGTLFLLFLFTLLRDAAMLVLAAARMVSPHLPQIAHTLRTALIFAAVAAVISIYGTYQAQQPPRVHEMTVPLQGLPKEFEGFRIVQLSDIHVCASRRADFAKYVTEHTNALEPDVILITGDFIDGRVETRRDDVAPLARLKAPCGVFGVLGNHEYFFNAKKWKKHIEEKLGIKILLNEHVILKRGAASIAVAGVADQTGLHLRDEEDPDPVKALAGIPSGTPIILMDHQPGAARKNAAAGAHLQLSGHTHGGMVPLLTTVVKRFNGGYVKGWYDVEGMKLYVSPGTGIWNGFLLRIGVPSEITVMTLTGGK